MLSAILLALSPFILNGVTWATNYATGFTSNAGKRFVLAVFALVGVIAASALSGNPVDPNSVSSLTQTTAEAFVAFVMGHGSYHLFFKGQQTGQPKV